LIRHDERLASIHPHLADVVRRAAMYLPFELLVVEGLRTLARQRELVAKGASKTLKSRHLTGHAVDLAPILDGEVRWDWPLFHQIAPAMKHAADDLDVAIIWGGDWRSFKDGPHFELDRKVYP
jgi:peptidoglycan L-alanyl-D-glutamate endopeptidase CwlK